MHVRQNLLNTIQIKCYMHKNQEQKFCCRLNDSEGSVSKVTASSIPVSDQLQEVSPLLWEVAICGCWVNEGWWLQKRRIRESPGHFLRTQQDPIRLWFTPPLGQPGVTTATFQWEETLSACYFFLLHWQYHFCCCFFKVEEKVLKANFDSIVRLQWPMQSELNVQERKE